MKIVILSGGSGNDSLIKGLEKLYSKNDVDIKVIVNAYDNGKSTGVCRKVTNTLGVSDIRKNHSRMYKAINGENSNPNILEFYNKRFDFEKGKETKQISQLLKNWGMSEYIKYAENFFKNVKANKFEYKDFSVSNIIYSEMYKEIGYEETNEHFCNKLGIDNFVVLNSFDNVYIKAQTQSGKVIDDEGKTVFWNNPNDKIINTIFDVKKCMGGVNPHAVKLVEEADLLIISTGTFWSSIQPTIVYQDFYKFINSSKAKKIWVMNNEEDGDSFGVSSLEFVDYMEQTGLDLSQFDIIVNEDARDSMKLVCNKYNFIKKSMGNKEGKHDGDKYARSLLQIYYGIENSSAYDKIIFDFDDTIWSRNNSEKEERLSIENVVLINNHLSDKAMIISGNSYQSLRQKLSKAIDNDFEKLNIDIWADANSTLFRHNKMVDFIEQLVIDSKAKIQIDKLVNEYSLNVENVGVKPVNYKIKPLTNLERELLVDIVEVKYKGKFKTCITGKTTVDILNKNNNKEKVFEHCNMKGLKTLFIGDEIDCGNDKEIATKCTKAVKVQNACETNLLLKLLIGD